jgi:(1->4)-alpha-D-glucan 1-alpha-D-glucosylmutase
MLKSIREARLRTNWIVPREEYEAQVRAHVEAALSERDDNAFLVSFRAFERSMAVDGAQNGLIETVLKLTTPGVPDVYQGAELWEQSTVDPDNRRSVDYALRREMLARVGDPGRADDIPSGMSKLALIARLLAFRAQHPALFAKGGYEPVEVSGPDADRVFAFRRHCEGEPTLLVAVALWPWRGAVEAQLEGIDATTGWVDVLSGRLVSDPERIMASGKNVVVLATT